MAGYGLSLNLDLHHRLGKVPIIAPPIIAPSSIDEAEGKKLPSLSAKRLG
jgi:hypothetical protein